VRAAPGICAVWQEGEKLGSKRGVKERRRARLCLVWAMGPGSAERGSVTPAGTAARSLR